MLALIKCEKYVISRHFRLLEVVMTLVGVFMRMLDKIEDDVAYISIRKRLTRCLMLKIEVVVTLMVMMTMMVMMAVQSRDEHNEFHDQRNDQDYDYEEFDVSDYDEDYYGEYYESDGTYDDDQRPLTSESVEMNAITTQNSNGEDDCDLDDKYDFKQAPFPQKYYVAY